jgi:hypothetical protein
VGCGVVGLWLVNEGFLVKKKDQQGRGCAEAKSFRGRVKIGRSLKRPEFASLETPCFGPNDGRYVHMYRNRSNAEHAHACIQCVIGNLFQEISEAGVVEFEGLALVLF